MLYACAFKYHVPGITRKSLCLKLEVKRFTKILMHCDSDASSRFKIRFDKNSVRLGSFSTRKNILKTLEK